MGCCYKTVVDHLKSLGFTAKIEASVFQKPKQRAKALILTRYLSRMDHVLLLVELQIPDIS